MHRHMDLWNRFFGMLDKQPDMDMSYADYLTAQLEMVKEKFTEDEYKLLQQDIETIRRLDAEMDMLMPKGDMTADAAPIVVSIHSASSSAIQFFFIANVPPFLFFDYFSTAFSPIGFFSSFAPRPSPQRKLTAPVGQALTHMPQRMHSG